MTSDTAALIDRSITDLQDLASHLASEIQAPAPSATPSRQALRRKEALLSISVLLPKLAAARGDDTHPELLRRGCQHCEGD